MLQVEELRVRFPGAEGRAVEAVRGISFSLGSEKLGIVGESGSGKSQTGRAIMRLVRAPGQVTGRIKLGDVELTALPERDMRDIRGRRISMIMQDPRYSLNPVMRVGEQIDEVFVRRLGLSGREARIRSLALLDSVWIRDAERVYRAYSWELSGGMGQRVMIAMMLAQDPGLLIADEPTSALDASVQTQVLDVLHEQVSARGMGLIFISHDLDLVASFCDRVLIMLDGEIVEDLAASELRNARHPYTQGLLASRPTLDRRQERLPTVSRRG